MNVAQLTPVVAPWLAQNCTETAMYLRYGEKVAELTGTAARDLVAPAVALFDGQHTVADIADRLQVSVDTIGRVVALLEQADLLVPEPVPALVPGATFVSATMPGFTTPADAAERLSSYSVAIMGTGTVALLVSLLLRNLGFSRLDVIQEPSDCRSDLLVVAADHRDIEELGTWNEELHVAEQTWLPVHPRDEQRMQIGPLIIPGTTACFRCVEVRWSAAAPYSQRAWAAMREQVATVDCAPLHFTAAGAVAMMVLRWATLADPTLIGTVTIEDGTSWTRETHRVLRVPRCDVCSSISQTSPPSPWTLL